MIEKEKLIFKLDTYNIQRKGFKSKKGVPDIIVWFKIYCMNSKIYWQVPLLIELESVFENALIDFKKFADRSYSDLDKITIPIIVKERYRYKYEICKISVKYIIKEINIRACNLDESSGEHELFEKIKEWANESQNYISIGKYYKHFNDYVLQFPFNLKIFNAALKGYLPLIYLNKINYYDLYDILKQGIIHLPSIVITKKFKGKEKIKNHQTWAKLIWLNNILIKS